MKERIALGFQNEALYLDEISTVLQDHDGKRNPLNFLRDIASFVLIAAAIVNCELAILIDPSLAT